MGEHKFEVVVVYLVTALDVANRLLVLFFTSVLYTRCAFSQFAPCVQAWLENNLVKAFGALDEF